MRVDDLTAALRQAATDRADVDEALEAVYRRRDLRRRRGLGVGAVVAALVVVGVIVSLLDGSDDVVTTDRVSEIVVGEWEQLPDPPLSPRSNTTMVWTGDEILVVGGDRFWCPPSADCDAPVDPPMRDGAAFDPRTREWRPIAEAPIGFAFADTAVVGDSVYFLISGYDQDTEFLRYSLRADSWEQLPPPDEAPTGRSLTATADTVIAVYGSAELGTARDQVFDAETATWRDLPADPLGPTMSRQSVWVAPHLYLFAQDLVDNPGSEGPSLARVARLDLGSGVWEELPPTESLEFASDIGAGMPATETKIVNPRLGGADGGEVNPWDREYPYGGIYDISVPGFRDLPEAPDDRCCSAGAIGPDRIWIDGAGTDRLLFDLTTETWLSIPGLPDDDPNQWRRNVIGTDDAVFAYGGERWDWDDPGTILGDAWILTIERP